MFELLKVQYEILDLLKRVDEGNQDRSEIITEIRRLYSTVVSSIDSIDREMSEYEY